MSYADRPRVARDRRAGFTLVELIVGLVLGTILAGIVFQMMQGQGEFVSLQSAREEAQQNARGAVEVMGAELRSAFPGAIAAAEPHTLEYYQPVVWGILCAPSTSGSAVALFPNPGGSEFDLKSNSGVLIENGADTDDWRPVTTVGPRSRLGFVNAVTTASCATDFNPDGDFLVRELKPYTGFSLPAGMPAGSRVVIYRRLMYDVGTSSGEEWIRRTHGERSDGTLDQQPLAGPLPSRSDLTFRYLHATTGAALATPVPVAQLDSIGRIRVIVRTQADPRSSASMQYETDSLTIHLRNR